MPTEREKMLRGEFFDGNDPELTAMRRRARSLLMTLNASLDPDETVQQSILAELFGSVGGWVSVQPPFYCDYGKNISVGSGVFFNYNCVILDVAGVEIGNGVLFGPNVQIYAAAHPVDAAARMQNSEFGKPIRISDQVWIGGSTVVCPGVSIGARTTIGAGSVVTHDVPEGVLAAGNPCRILRQLD
jgi:maltose O-acetyltransferase